MKRLTILSLMCAICLSSIAQVTVTPKARLAIEQRKAKTTRLQNGPLKAPEQQRMTFVVKVAEENARETFAQLRALGATIQGKIGRQAVISIPVNQIDAIQQVKGLQRIDTGHKGQWKTDIARQKTGVSTINGPTATLETPYTGRDVTICMFDNGIDFQHPAFKDAEGNSRIKCVFLIGDESGKKYTVEDPEAGTIEFPGSVYDTPELIAQLTTDAHDEYHGTHTTSIAAGSLSPMGFGGMAPEADIVFVGTDENIDSDQLKTYFDTEDAIVELVLAFAADYAQKSGKPLVFSGSLNYHGGPHDGTGTVPEALEAASKTIIPVMSAGNEGGYPIHLYKKFTAQSKSVKTVLAIMPEGEGFSISDETVGYTRQGDRLGVKLSVVTINPFSGKTQVVWNSEELTATPGCEPQVLTISSEDDASLAKYFDGSLGITAFDNDNGKLAFMTMTDGTFDSLCLFQLTVTGSEGTEVDMWDNFGGFNIFEFPGFVIGDSEMSGGDWTCTPGVISVGAYCTNTDYRSYDGSPMEDEDDEVEYTLDDYAYFSSYGTSFNGVTQPVVSAPGVNIVSAWNHYCLPEDATMLDGMQWQGYPYGAESGTSMACPVVSGIIACWLQANPALTLDDVKEVLRQTSVNDSFTTHDPIRWGFGKVNAEKGIDYIVHTTAMHGIKESPATGHGAVYDLQGRRVAAPTHGIYVKDGHKFVVR